jgi:hypothetical protein
VSCLIWKSPLPAFLSKTTSSGSRRTVMLVMREASRIGPRKYAR